MIVPPINYQTYIKKAWHYRISRWQSTKFSGCSNIMLSVCRVCKGCVMNHPSSNASDSGHRDSQLKTIYLSKQARDPTNELKKILNILNRSFPPNRPRILVVSCQRRKKRIIDATTISRGTLRGNLLEPSNRLGHGEWRRIMAGVKKEKKLLPTPLTSTKEKNLIASFRVPRNLPPLYSSRPVFVQESAPSSPSIEWYYQHLLLSGQVERAKRETGGSSVKKKRKESVNR